MGITVYSLLWVLQYLYHQLYQGPYRSSQTEVAFEVLLELHRRLSAAAILAAETFRSVLWVV